MRRENRGNNSKLGVSIDKILLYAGIGVGVLTIIVFALFMYSKNINEEVKNSTMSLGKMASILENSTQNNINSNNTINENTQSASTDIGKTVEEAKKEENNTNTQNISEIETRNNNNNEISEENLNNTKDIEKKENVESQTANIAKVKESKIEENKQEEEKPTESVKELSFQMPVDGEICKEYAKDNLVYSATLDEWTTHLGIDIKAEKTTVVKAAEEGIVKSIKNDPRYGLTIVIEHANNFQTVYSNLLTSEFVVEGEKVEKGQSIGTVGDTGVFEIADEPHLHFEILKDSLPEDPNIYIQ